MWNSRTCLLETMFLLQKQAGFRTMPSGCSWNRSIKTFFQPRFQKPFETIFITVPKTFRLNRPSPLLFVCHHSLSDPIQRCSIIFVYTLSGDVLSGRKAATPFRSRPPRISVIRRPRPHAIFLITFNNRGGCSSLVPPQRH